MSYAYTAHLEEIAVLARCFRAHVLSTGEHNIHCEQVVNTYTSQHTQRNSRGGVVIQYLSIFLYATVIYLVLSYSNRHRELALQEYMYGDTGIM